MACLRGTPFAGCGRALQCDEEGCKFRPYAARSDYPADEAASQADCVLQLRLRAGAAADVVEHTLKSYERGKREDLQKELNAYISGSVFAGGARLRSVSLDPVPLDPACTIQTVKPAEDAGSTWSGPQPNHVYLDEYRQWVGDWEKPEKREPVDYDAYLASEAVVYKYPNTKKWEPTEFSVGETEWNFNPIKMLAERYPSTIKEFSYFPPDRFKVPVNFRRHGPNPDTRGYRLLEKWEDDFDVPEYVIDAFREYLETGE